MVAGWLAVLPPLLVLGAYFPGLVRNRTLPLPDGDARNYVYQVRRAADLGGRWWQLDRDEPVGRPYPSGWPKNAGLYEGVDLLLAAPVVARWLGPVASYFALVASVAVVNGWVAGYLTHRLTGSVLWASVSVVLLLLNQPTAWRMRGHLHLYEHAWWLLLVWAFSRYLDAPRWQKGAALGLAFALVLQGSFYVGYLATLLLGAWWLAAVVAGRLDRRWVVPTGAAVLVAGLAAVPVVWPLVTHLPTSVVSGSFLARARRDTWTHGAELWQYLVSPHWALGPILWNAAGRVSWEGWNFPGVAILAGTAIYLVGRARGVVLARAEPVLVRRLFGLAALAVLLSLSGGVSALLCGVLPMFRAYGRAGLLAIGLLAVAVPVVWQAAIDRIASRWLRATLRGAVLGLALCDGYLGQQFFDGHPPPMPPWVGWLAAQPATVRAAVLPFMDGTTNRFITWEADFVFYWTLHRHETLSGCESQLYARDLFQLGADPDHLNPASLAFITSLGYTTLIAEDAFLRVNPWLGTTPWLEPTATLGEWRVLQSRPTAPLHRRATFATMLAEAAAAPRLARVPAAAWITDGFALDAPVVIDTAGRVRLVWIDAAGRRVRRPDVGLVQHFYSASLPAFTIRTPRVPGRYRLQFVDDDDRVLGERAYEVAADVPTAVSWLSQARPEEVAALVTVREGARPDEVVIENRSNLYVQVHPSREPQLGDVDRLQPWMAEPRPGALRLVVRTPRAAPEEPPLPTWLLPPHDLAAHGSAVIRLAETGFGPGVAAAQLDPVFREPQGR